MRSNIKFTTNQSTQEVNFLDVTVKLNDGIISTTGQEYMLCYRVTLKKNNFRDFLFRNFF